MRLDQPLITQRLVLRTLTHEDATERYASWLADIEVVRYLELRLAPAQTPTDIANFIAAANSSEDTLLLGICLKGDGRHIGNIKIGPISAAHRRGDIGFLIGEREQWGKGYAAEAIRAMSDHALGPLALEKLTAGCYGGHTGSARALEAAGFSREAVLPKHWICEGQRLDGWLFGKHR